MFQASTSRRAARLVCLCALSAAAQAAITPAPCFGADKQWVGTFGQWQTPANWSPSLPAAGDNALLTHAAPSSLSSIDYIPSAQPPASYIPPLLGNVLVDTTGGAASRMNFSLFNGYRLDAAALTVGH